MVLKLSNVLDCAEPQNWDGTHARDSRSGDTADAVAENRFVRIKGSRLFAPWVEHRKIIVSLPGSTLDRISVACGLRDHVTDERREWHCDKLLGKPSAVSRAA
jgi:hypothetical protein